MRWGKREVSTMWRPPGRLVRFSFESSSYQLDCTLASVLCQLNCLQNISKMIYKISRLTGRHTVYSKCSVCYPSGEVWVNLTTRLPTLFLLLMSLSGGLASSAAAQASHGSDRGAGVRSPSVMLMRLMNACNEGHKFREKQRKRRTRDGTIHNVLNQDSIKNALNFLFI